MNLWASRMPTRYYCHSCWAWSSIFKVLKVISLQYLYNISKKKLGKKLIFCIQMSIKVCTSWDYCFWCKWPKYPKKEVGNLFAKSVAAAFVFYCDAKHSDILWVSSHVYCYILVSLHSQTRNLLPKGHNTIIKEHLCGEGFPSLFYLLQVDVFNRSRVYRSKSSYVHQTSQKNLVSGILIQIISPKFLQESTVILQLKVYIIYVMRKLVGHPPW